MIDSREQQANELFKINRGWFGHIGDCRKSNNPAALSCCNLDALLACCGV